MLGLIKLTVTAVNINEIDNNDYAQNIGNF